MKKSLLLTIIMIMTMSLQLLADTVTQTYANNSVLATGKWAKISVSETGISRLTNEVIQKAGFSNLAKVKIYGYGGAIIPERLTQEWLAEHDDLKEIPTFTYNNAKYFNAIGTVTWDSKTAQKRTRNTYANFGYYFITEGNDTPLSCTEAELLAKYNEANERYHTLYENEQFSYSNLGRDLIDGTEIKTGQSHTVNITIPAGNTSASIQVSVAAGDKTSFKVGFGANASSTGSFSMGEYDRMKLGTYTKTVNDLADYAGTDGTITYPITLTCTGTNPVRFDYVSAYFSTPFHANSVATATTYAAEFVETISNQNHHADKPVDLLIIVPTSGELLSAANELAEHHRSHDGMSVRIIKANELYNEFSSGTPDISAYKRYAKMFYDKAQGDKSQILKNILLFGDAVWDNRMLTLPKNSYSVDRYLLGYQTTNSTSLLSSFVSDDFITVLDDGKNIHVDNNDSDLRFKVGVGRLPVVNASDAQILVKKIKEYVYQIPYGTWQNEIMFIGDDGFYRGEKDKDNDNSHMINMNINADAVIKNSPGYHVKKVMMDAYERKSTSTGDRYPEVETLVKKQQNDGALIMNYGGHASWTELSTQKILSLNDFIEFKGKNYSFWFTAGCETVPFDQTYNTMGEAALLNKSGGAIAFYGTSRTVTESNNSKMDLAMMKHVLEYDENDNPRTLGEAQMLAKNDLVAGNTQAGTERSINKHQYILIGDPAMSLAIPRNIAVVDSINGNNTENITIVSGNSTMTIKGHIQNHNGVTNSNFNGIANILIRDSKKEVQCRGNNDPYKPFTFTDWTSTLYKGSCQIVNGEFSLICRIPRDIYNDGGNGLITIFAIDEANNVTANGECDRFSAKGWEDSNNDELGPSIYCYLNNTSFRNGDNVGLTPFFVAEISDKDGINASGSSLGHHMELIVDNEVSKTYDITNNFTFDNNSYTSGQTFYVIDELTPGPHTLQFKAWDLMNNSNTVSLNFNVVKKLKPELEDIRVSPNPIKGSTTFYIKHDMRGSEAKVSIEIISPSGKISEILEWNEIFTDRSDTSTYSWTPSGLARGIYLYRVRISCNGSDYVSKTKRLIIAQ